MEEQRIVLVDGYAMIYRSFHAMPPFKDANDRLVNAVYGMARFFFGLQKKMSPQYCALVLDKGRCTKRTEILPEYKAQRPPMPEELRGQIALIREWAELFGWQILEKEGVEADDIIAGICLHHGEQNNISVVSYDKDLVQLVNNHVEMLRPAPKDNWIHFGVDQVIDKYFLTPNQICDFLSILGDSSDNIPGLPGVGEKTAAKLLGQYDTIEGIYDHLSELTPSLQAKFAGGRELLDKNRELILLDYQLPQEWQDISLLQRKEIKWSELLQRSEELGFKSLQKFFPKDFSQSNNPLPIVKKDVEQKDDSPKQLSLF